MIKKLIIISIGITVLATTGLLIFRYKDDKSKVVPVETGAIITKPPQSEMEPYDQMYTLLDKGVVSEKGFEIQPIKQKRIFNVKLKEPLSTSKVKFEEWLKENNFDKIPKEKFIFAN